jgi:hypothetical protein
MPLSMIELADSMLQKRTGVTSYNQGLDANSLNKTATGISKIMAASAQRIELIARVMAETGIRPLYQKLLMLNQQFIDQTVVIRVFNKPLEISPDDLAGDFDVNVDVGGATNRDEVRSQQLMMMIQYAGNLISLGVMRPENVYETVKQLMTIWGWRDYERYLSDPNETEQMKQILAMIEQMGMAMQPGQAPAPEQLIQAFQMIYQTLGQIIGPSEGLQQGGTPSSEDVALATGGENNGGQYSASSVPSGLPNLQVS